MSVSDAYNFRQVDALISTAGLLGEAQLATLAAEGYRAVINLLPHDSEYAVPGEEALVRAQGLSYTSIPVDFAAPSGDDYRAFEAALAALGGQRTLIHCAANFRVSAFFAIYARRRLGWSREQAHGFIATVWQIDENPVWHAFVSEHSGD